MTFQQTHAFLNGGQTVSVRIPPRKTHPVVLNVQLNHSFVISPVIIQFFAWLCLTMFVKHSRKQRASIVSVTFDRLCREALCLTCNWMSKLSSSLRACLISSSKATYFMDVTNSRTCFKAKRDVCITSFISWFGQISICADQTCRQLAFHFNHRQCLSQCVMEVAGNAVALFLLDVPFNFFVCRGQLTLQRL